MSQEPLKGLGSSTGEEKTSERRVNFLPSVSSRRPDNLGKLDFDPISQISPKVWRL